MNVVIDDYEQTVHTELNCTGLVQVDSWRNRIGYRLILAFDYYHTAIHPNRATVSEYLSQSDYVPLSDVRYMHEITFLSVDSEEYRSAEHFTDILNPNQHLLHSIDFSRTMLIGDYEYVGFVTIRE